ncbi:beta-glucosidase [Microbacter margulisiae]|uniref:Beta-glucosidase n=1 Tax=Microbacter margulisiae TaxID=1350067 RepID=A0A7W5H3D8_9PORP|nr:glycoside hydrolase family 3 C-terminal domain-containing protein [Microbacter margulisiae]MBB3188297.1 beta-glucosidase [Microbacter margulisiae]
MKKQIIFIGMAVCLALPMALKGAITAPKADHPDFNARARKIVAQMTLDEKISQLHGIQNDTDFRIVPGIPRLGIPPLTVCNGPAGLGPAGYGHQGKATALSAPISLAATWDTQAAYDYGKVAGEESLLLGNIFLESPDVNIARTPHGGRTFESFGEDPFLTSRMGVGEIKGIQSCGIIANVKHYVANNQESDRFKINEIIDGRTLREIYLPAFRAAVEEGHVGSVMAAYNKVNGTFCSENDFLLTDILRKEWKFDGFITSDFGAVHSTVPAARGGLDVEMPTGIYFGNALKRAVMSGEVSESLLNEKLIRRYSTMMRFGVWETPQQGAIPVMKDAAIAMKIGAEGVVLLKNQHNVLPLDIHAIHSIALIGPFAGEAMTGGGGSSHVEPILTVSPMEGIQKLAGANVSIQVNDGTDIARALAIAKKADVTILMLGDRQTEGRDHPITLSGNQDALAEAVLNADPHAIVVLKTGGPVLMPWIAKASALLEAWYPGEEDGNVVASVLFGEVNPSGKLPITFPQKDSDLPTQTVEQYPGVNGTVHYSEGILVGYRWYDAKQIKPLFPFGYGLSYTTFAYKDLTISKPEHNTVTVGFIVTNTGKRAGAEVAQLYLGMPSTPAIPQPPLQLKGFKRVNLAPGQSAHVSITLNAHDLSYWDTTSHAWKIMPGVYKVYAAASSQDIQLKGNFRMQ